MTSENTNPQVWLSETPLLPGERLYLIVSAASDAEALKTLYQNEPTTQAIPIWGGTPYAAWQPVMPYLTELKPNSSFLPWIAETDALDWGWLAVSSSEPNVVFEHLRSLTQVRMPDGTEVFFRFWDGRHIYPILEGLGDAAGEPEHGVPEIADAVPHQRAVRVPVDVVAVSAAERGVQRIADSVQATASSPFLR